MGRVRKKRENKHGCVCPMIGDGYEYKIVQRFFLFALHLCSSVFIDARGLVWSKVHIVW